VAYSGERNCVISAGGLSGILNVLLATIEVGDEVIVTDPTMPASSTECAWPAACPLRNLPVYGGRAMDARSRSARPRRRSKTRAMLLMSPSMPSGAVSRRRGLAPGRQLCVANDLLLILDTAMGRLMFDGREVIHPAGLPGMAARTITVGSSAKELRMIGWRVGWVVGPEDLMPDIVAVSLANVVVPVGIAQGAVATALENSRASIGGYVADSKRGAIRS